MQLTILSWNACSITREKRELLLQYCDRKDIDIFCIQETWLKPNVMIPCKGFNIMKNDRITGRKNRVMIGIRSHIHYRELDLASQQSIDNEVEVVGTKLFLKNEKEMDIIFVYNPSGNNGLSGERIDEIIKMMPVAEDMIILGDMNAHSKSWCKCRNVNSSGKSLENCLINSPICLATHIEIPTRVNPQTGETTTIDLLLCDLR